MSFLLQNKQKLFLQTTVVVLVTEVGGGKGEWFDPIYLDDIAEFKRSLDKHSSHFKYVITNSNNANAYTEFKNAGFSQTILVVLISSSDPRV